MAAPILTTVRDEATTVIARLAALVVASVTLGLTLGVISADQGEAILGFINSPKTASLVSAVGTIILAFLPATQGWRSRDRELPTGVTIEDVELKGTAK